MNFVGADLLASTEGGLVFDSASVGSSDIVAVYLVEDDAAARACSALPAPHGFSALTYPLEKPTPPLDWLCARVEQRPRCLIVFRLSDFQTADELNAVRVWIQASELPLLIPLTEASRSKDIEPLRANERAIEWSELHTVTAALLASGGSALRSVGSRTEAPGAAETDSEVGADAPAMLAELVQQVRKTARQVCRRLPQGMRQDAEGAAMVGLMEALQRFDDVHSQHFGNYLRVRVKGAIRDEARRFDPLSRSARELVNGVERVTDEHRRLHGRSPEIDEVARELGVDEDTCWQALELSEFSSLPIDDDTVSNSVHTSEDLFVETYAATALRWALGQLDKRTRLVLRLWYKRGLPVAAIARRLGVSAARTHQIRVEGEQQLRQILRHSPPLRQMNQASAPFDWDDETRENRGKQRVS